MPESDSDHCSFHQSTQYHSHGSQIKNLRAQRGTINQSMYISDMHLSVILPLNDQQITILLTTYNKHKANDSHVVKILNCSAKNLLKLFTGGEIVVVAQLLLLMFSTRKTWTDKWQQ